MNLTLYPDGEEVQGGKCQDCRHQPVQRFLASLRSGTYLLQYCEEHRMEPHPVLVELTPLQALALSDTICIA